MNDTTHGTNVVTISGRGTTRSYVIGFILSLTFTFISYYLVVNHTVSGTALFATVLALAVGQMVTQITFFLHLGQGPKPKWNLFFFISTVGIILVVVGGSIMIIHNLHYNMLPSDQTSKLVNDEGIYQIGGEKTGACQQIKTNHNVTIKNGAVSPRHTEARRCDTLTFINEDNKVVDVAFGPHPGHEVYAGKSELLVQKGRGKSITLSESGTYQFHDHLHEATAGEFSVKP